MRRPGLLLLALLPMLMVACNANPLLTAAASDYAPVAVGEAWTYAQPGTATPLVRTVSAQLAYHGREAFKVDTTSAGGPSTAYWSFSGGDWYAWDPVLGWILYRRLPYVTGNSWPIQTTDPVNIVATTYVEGPENVGLASAYYANCFKLRTETLTYSGGVTSTTEAISWAAPGVGDIKVEQVDSAGTVTVLGELSRFQAP
jgi:hypothetical protein